MKLFRYFQSDPISIASHVKELQASECAQLVLGIVKALRKLESLCPGRADLGGFTFGVYQRTCERRMELHLAACVWVRSRPLEKVSVEFGVTTRDRVQLAVLGKLFERVGAGRFEEPIARQTPTDIR